QTRMQRDTSSRGVVETSEPDQRRSAEKNVRLAPEGTFNRLAKFASDGTSLVDSVITETGGNVGIGTTNPLSILDVSSGNPLPRVTLTNPNSFGALYFYQGGSLLSGFQLIGTNFPTVSRRVDMEFFTAGGGDITFAPGNAGNTVEFQTGGNILFVNKWRTETTAYTPNLIGGFLGTGGDGTPTPGNRVTAGVVGATIGGGGFNGDITFPSSVTLSGDKSNRVTDWFGTVGGGFNNMAGNNAGTLEDAFMATVGGGASNTASGTQATVGGGFANTASGLN